MSTKLLARGHPETCSLSQFLDVLKHHGISSTRAKASELLGAALQVGFFQDDTCNLIETIDNISTVVAIKRRPPVQRTPVARQNAYFGCIAFYSSAVGC